MHSSTSSSSSGSGKNIKNELDSLKHQLEDCLIERNKKDRENAELQNALKRHQQMILDSGRMGNQKITEDILSLQKRNRELEHINEDYRDEIKCLKLEMKELSEECQSKMMKLTHNKTTASGAGELSNQQQSVDCLREQNAKLKEEIKMLEQELDEIQDTFKEEESEQLESLKQDLDLASKNCRILQFKLKKSERQYTQLEQVKITLEKQLEDMCSQRPQEQQFSLLSSDNRQYSNSSSGGNNGNSGRSLDGPTITLPSSEYDQLIRDLHDTMEREKDLQEQIKYCQEESRISSVKLSALESENEILMNKVSKLVETKSNASALVLLGRQKSNQNDNTNSSNSISDTNNSSNVSELLQQIEQLKLGLEISQNENTSTKANNQKLKLQLEQSDSKLKILQKKPEEKTYLSELSNTGGGDYQASQRLQSLQVECRQLRTKLIESDRENRQLRTRAEFVSATNNGGGQQQSHKSNDSSNNLDTQLMLNRSAVFNRSRSLEQQTQNANSSQATTEISKCRAELSMIKTQNDMLMRQNSDLQDRIRSLVRDNQTNTNSTSSATKQESQLESELIAQLKDRLRSLEEELVNKKSKIVELELDNTRIQREYKKLKQALECKRPPSRLNQLRDTSSRQELRDIIRELEEDLVQAQSIQQGKEAMFDSCREELNQLTEKCDKLKSERDCLVRELSEANTKSTRQLRRGSSGEDKSASVDYSGNSSRETTLDEQLETYKLQLEQERFCISNLKNDIRKLEASKNELASQNRMLERERVSMEEEVDKMRTVNRQQLEKIDELASLQRTTNNRVNELNITNDRVKSELSAIQKKLDNQKNFGDIGGGGGGSGQGKLGDSAASNSNRIQMLERDCDDLRAKNRFLINKIDGLEIEFKAKADELKAQFESQKKREMELARLEVKEKLQIEMQHIKDELNEARQKLTNASRQQNKADYEYRTIDERYKTLDKEFKREKVRLTSKIDQLEQDLDFERRKQDHLEREKESQLKDKSRQLMNVQDTCVQLERDLKRAQAKLSSAESDFEARLSNLNQEVSKEKREKEELTKKCRKSEENYYDQKMRSESEKSTLVEALDSVRKSYNEKIDEIKSIRELLTVRQDQHFKEKLLMQEKLQAMEATIGKFTTLDYDFRQLKNRCETQEANLEQFKKDERVLREEKTRLRSRCDELERKCSFYEKQELASKTSSISPTQRTTLSVAASSTRHINFVTNSKSDHDVRLEQVYAELDSIKIQLNSALEDNDMLTKKMATDSNGKSSEYSLSEKLTGKINDQRHHIKTLETQIDSLVAELKNTNLLHKAEKSSWQVQMAQLRSNLNEKEERLLLETSSRLATRNLAKTKMEIAWQKERQTNHDLLLKQQQQIQTLTEDLRQTIQSVESMKEARQHDNRRHEEALTSLSQSNKNLSQGTSEKCSLLRQQLDICEDERSRLHHKVISIGQYNDKVMAGMLKELEPLLPIVGKIISSLDKADASKDELDDQVADQAIHQSSTNRPLRTTTKNSNLPDDGDDEASLASETTAALSKTNLASSNKSASSSRLSRFLSMKPSSAHVNVTTTDNTLSDSKNTPSDSSTKVKAKTPKKAKIRSSAIGISASEKKQMKMCLKRLEKSIEDIKSLPAAPARDQKQTLDYSKTLAKRTSVGVASLDLHCLSMFKQENTLNHNNNNLINLSSFSQLHLYF